ncbi:cell division protein FtsA [Campylobacter showae]|uniref:Cell division protein FtsA n=2 Tax=Campylobacter TaxID=194 RepID=C6RGA3_9BACT|nr:cell division protein FtsA [Campylobacter showae]EET79453.1 cell division protein FtsA [Campylobacter showae RM3277]QCD49093.1 cell division protein FtsA [Campylobacter showae]RKV95522.1 MAG: cell division protein FtsA [Campylobacter sp.]
MSTKILGIDVGSVQICAVIGQHDETGLKIIGIGTAKTQGIKKGVITNIELASKSIKSALIDAQRVAGTRYEKVVVSISGAYTKSVDSNGVVNVPTYEIGIKEIQRSMSESERRAQIHSDYEKLHILPYNFKVDDQEHIEDPLGMNGSRLEVQTHIIMAQKSSLSNLRKALNLAGVEPDNIVLSSYASAIATLNQDEKDLGVAFIDMGGATCNMIIHSGNSIRYNEFLGIGSSNITNDLSAALHTPILKAEDIKLNYGILLNNANELVEIPPINEDGKVQEVSLDVISNVIYARAEETLMILAKMLEDSGYKNSIAAGVVLTGGMTKLEGIRELAIAVFDNMPVRIARPKEMEGLYEILRDPANSCAIGLCMYGAGYFTPYEIDSEKKMRYKDEIVVKNKILKDIVYDNGVKIEDKKNIEEVDNKIFRGSTLDDNYIDDLRIDDDRTLQDELNEDLNKKEKKPNIFSVIWNKITQLF